MNANRIRPVLEALGVIALFYEHWMVAGAVIAAFVIITKVVSDKYAKKVITGLMVAIMAMGGFWLFPYFAPISLVLAVALIIVWFCEGVRLTRRDVA